MGVSMGAIRWGIRGVVGATTAMASYAVGSIYVLGYFAVAGLSERARNP
jgi:hypothetical protein